MRRVVSRFIYFSFAMSLSVLIMFIWIERSGTSRYVQFDGRLRKSVSDYMYPVESVRVTSKEDALKRQIFEEIRGFSCSKILDGNVAEIERANTFLKSHGNNFSHISDESFEAMTLDCENYSKYSKYWLEPPDKDETGFPLAFNIIFHENVEQLERLLRSIYRTHNQYCIHVDKKAPQSTHDAVLAIAACFENVFIASKLEVVVYASHTRLLADINCMRDHVERGAPWKYLVNVASSEFPLKTNREIVQILKVFNGANDIHEVLARRNLDRYKRKHFTYIDNRKLTGHIIHTNKQKEPPPYNLTITKGNAYNIFSRAFVEFVLDSDMARSFLGWCADTLTPDEHYWATLNNLYSNPVLKTPGGYKGNPDKKPFIARYIGWNSTELQGRCKSGNYRHNVCVFGVADVSQLKERKEIIANKFDIDFDPIAYRCMEEWLYNKTKVKSEIKDMGVYKRLPFIS